jgi:hypothetical protein
MRNTPTATRTGIVIGGAYVPRLPSDAADPIRRYPVEHPVTRAGHWVATRVGAVLLGVLVALLIGGRL